MKQYQSFEDIKYNLTCLKLERTIALEKMKLAKNEFTDNLKPANWIITIANVASKYGLYVLLKRFFK